MNDIYNQIIELTGDSRRILVTSHLDPDGDSIGSQLALKNWLDSFSKETKILNQGKIPAKYLFLDEKGDIEYISDPGEEVYEPDLVYVLECSNLKRIGKVSDFITNKSRIINIDHHADNSRFGYLNCIDTSASALGEIIYEIITYAGFHLTKSIATQLYAAILTDTGRFSFPNTTSRSLKICSDLIINGAVPNEINNNIYYSNSKAVLKLLGSTLQNVETYEEGKISFMFIKQKDMDDYKISADETEGLADYSLFLKGTEVGVLFRQKGDSLTKVSFRSQGLFDVSLIARIFGGGGHRNAAGCSVHEDLDSTKEMILTKIKERL